MTVSSSGWFPVQSAEQLVTGCLRAGADGHGLLKGSRDDAYVPRR
jgi:hypothetical protein